MSIAIGFGSVEKREEQKIEWALYDLDEESNHATIKAVQNYWKRKADQYDRLSKEDAPERYTIFYLSGGEFTFLHINRRHALSPDGWALLKVIKRRDVR